MAGGKIPGTEDEPKEKRRPPGRRGNLRKQVCYFYPDESAGIKAEAVEKECSGAEVVRRAVRRYLDP